MQRHDRNPYEALGLEPSATRVEIRAAYLRLAKKHHPDKNPPETKLRSGSSRRLGGRMNFSGAPAILGVHDETERGKRTLRRLTLDVSGMLENRNVSVENDTNRARRQAHAEQQEAGKTGRERRERAEYSRQQDRYEQQTRERAERERREEGQERTHRQGRSSQSERKHSESTSNNDIWEERLAEYLEKLPLPTALAYVLGVPSALIGFAGLRGINNSSSELLGVWLMFAGVTASAMRSKSKDWL